MGLLMVDDRDQMPAELWLHLPNLKKLAKVVREAAVVLHGRALNGLCRAAGYEDYNDALHHPKALSVSLEEWCRCVSREFDLGKDDLLPIGELQAWYPRIFVRRGWDAAQLRRGAPNLHLLPSAQDDEESCQSIPRGVDHRETIVDGMQQIRTRARTPARD